MSEEHIVTEVPTAAPVALPSGLRYYGGWIFFLLSLFMPLLGLAVPLLGLDKATSTILVGACVVGGPEVAIIIAVALWGRETFNHFRGRATGLLKHLVPPEHVSAGRYHVGLVLFFGSALPCWLLAYFPQGVGGYRVPVLVAADFVFIFSFWVLGGDFWGKLRALFVPYRELQTSRR